MTELKEYFKKNQIFVISIFFYVLMTLPFMLNHIPWYDEAHAYMQAYFMNFNNWVGIIKIEGHPLLWFLILMPFAKANWHYPYPMLVINYISSLAAILVLWKVAPFNKWLKVGVTFSSMFLIYFPIVARGYTIGVLLIFLLSALYKNKLEHPFLYPILVGLAMNLNIMCGIGASWFGLIFFIELLKSNLNTKTKAISCSILVFSTLLFIFPFLGGFGSEATYEYNTISARLNNIYLFFSSPILRIILFLSSIILILIKTHLCKEHTYLVYTYLLLLCLFAFFYPGGPHHFIFLYIYLLSFLWIYNEKCYNENKNGVCSLNSKADLPCIILILLLFMPLQYTMSNIYYGHKIHTKKLVSIINTQPKFKNSRLFINEREALIIPYLIDNKNIEIYSACNKKPLNWDMYDTHNCISLEILINELYDKDKDTYLFVSPDIHSKQFDKEFKIYEFPKKISSGELRNE